MAGDGGVTFSVGFDESSLASITNLLEFKSRLAAELAKIFPEIGDMLVNAAVDNTWSAFQNPTGTLAGTIRWDPIGDLEIEVGSDSPYARRLEEGFFGTDILGRSYHNEPEPYLMPAFTDNEDTIAAMIGNAVANVYADMGIME